MTTHPDLSIPARGRMIWLLIEDLIDARYPLTEVLPFVKEAADLILGPAPSIDAEFARRLDAALNVKIDDNFSAPIPAASLASKAPDDSFPTTTTGVPHQDDDSNAATVGEAAAETAAPAVAKAPKPSIPAGSTASITRPQMNVLEALATLMPKGKGSPSISEIKAQSGEPSVSMHLEALYDTGCVKNEGERGAPLYVILRRPESIEVRNRWNEARFKSDPGKNTRKEPDHRREPARRFEDHSEPDPENVRPLGPHHSALKSATTIFPKSVVAPADSERLLIAGHNSRKLGDRISKGEWAGMPLYYLTLEERATCPTSCHHWASCYGNTMPFARRHRHGPTLVTKLAGELETLAVLHPKGFVVRLHNLGDFYSVEYVDRWAAWLDEFKTLRVFGYTAWSPSTDIGKAILKLTDTRWDRFAIRFSSAVSRPQGATTIWHKPMGARDGGGIVCPAQTGKTDCCGSCGLCWSPAAKNETIVFIGHGMKGGRKPDAPTADTVARNIAAAKRLPPDAPAVNGANVEPAEEQRTNFATPVKRRCSICRQEFDTKSAAQTICSPCIGKVAGPPRKDINDGGKGKWG